MRSRFPAYRAPGRGFAPGAVRWPSRIRGPRWSPFAQIKDHRSQIKELRPVVSLIRRSRRLPELRVRDLGARVLDVGCDVADGCGWGCGEITRAGRGVP